MNAENIKASIQAVVDGLTPLAQKLGVAIEGLWGWAMKHNYAVAGELLFGALCGIILLIFSVWLIKKVSKLTMYDDEVLCVFGWIGGIAAFIGGAVCFVMCSIQAIDRIIAPEWNTAVDISTLIHGNTSTK